eukprot:TRINITY_DN43335_c0_g1_i1.p1 TRINITY_DN43335_c0_g1~~TRINITY_DN43335_c0_g1_i1.p1  ORF type:complete len:245 (+),score=6.71 TRINITY_DN43335_c0_g1_i1:861-1595(+)
MLLQVNRHRRCADEVVGEKTPSYFYVPFVPLVMCQLLGRPRIAVLLRDPVARAYSSFYQGDHLSGMGPRTAEGFDTVARIEVDLVRSCGAQPVGDPNIDQLRSDAFRSCCTGITRKYGFRNWPGCSCHQPPCHVFGDRRAAQIRMGIYVWSLRIFFTYHSPEHVLIARSEDFFQHGVQVLKETLLWAKPSLAARIEAAPLVSQHTNSQASQHEPMLPQTRDLLREFYAPYNAELEGLVGRPLHW